MDLSKAKENSKKFVKKAVSTLCIAGLAAGAGYYGGKEHTEKAYKPYVDTVQKLQAYINSDSPNAAKTRDYLVNESGLKVKSKNKITNVEEIERNLDAANSEKDKQTLENQGFKVDTTYSIGK